jgi:26S proteasome regulatory subunit N1
MTEEEKKKTLKPISRSPVEQKEKEKKRKGKMVVEKASQPPAAASSGDAADAAASSKKKPLSKKDAAAKEAEAELSEEYQELKDKLDLCVLRLSEVGERPDAAALAPAAVRSLAEEVRTSTTSMTSVPKPLKFLRPQYASLCASQEKLSAIGASSEDAARELADVLSVLAISSGTKGGREALKWRLKGKQVSKRRR